MPLVRSPSLSFSSPLEHPKGVQGTRFLGRRGGREASPALQISPIRSRSSELGQEFPHLEVSSDIHRSLCRARDKDPWQWESGSPGGVENRGPQLAQESPGAGDPAGCVLPAGKLQRRTARVGHNPRAERPAPLPIPIHPARPVTTSLSLEEV